MVIYVEIEENREKAGAKVLRRGGGERGTTCQSSGKLEARAFYTSKSLFFFFVILRLVQIMGSGNCNCTCDKPNRTHPSSVSWLPG